MLELRTLGSVGIHDGPTGLLAASPKPLALLVYLAVARPRGPQRRDTLLALFHPELDYRHARMALRQLTHALRAVVGPDAVRSERQTIGLHPERLTCDVHAFAAAVAEGDHAGVVAAYGGPFLSGFFLGGCPEFERWVEAERHRLERAYVGALERLALAADATGDTQQAVALWQQLADVDPYATRVTVRLIAALGVAGDRAGALHVAERHGQRLKEELAAEPAPEVEALARRLRLEPAPSTPAPAGTTRERLTRAVAGRYRVNGVAGAGGMALVYRADDLKLGRPVALKVLRPELAAAMGHERFLNEVDIAASLAHPNILPLHDVGEADGLLYYVMPYVEGESLRARLARDGTLPVAEALRITTEVADALAHAHERGIVHRDIKPANILLLADHAVVSDFGVARALGEATEERALLATTGTPAYMSPEQAAGSPEVDGRSDLYSLGCVLHEMVTGMPPPFVPQSPALAATTAAEPVLAAGEPVPVAVRKALATALAPNPADRFATAREFAAALTLPARSRARAGRRRVALLGAVTVSAVAAIAGWQYRRATANPGPQHITVSNLRQVTRAPEIEVHPAVSPDGREVAYSSGIDLQWHLVVMDLESGLSHPFPADPTAPRTVPRWTPDGTGIVFHQGVEVWNTTSHLIPRRGGPMTTVVDASVWDVSHDRIVYTRPEGLFVRNVGGGEETLVARYSPEVHSAVWSPDGSTLAYVQGNGQWRQVNNLGNVAPSSIWIVSAVGGEPVQVTDSVHLNVSPAWMPDGRHLLFVSDRDGTRDIYAVQLGPSGRPRSRPERLTTALRPHSISVSADGSRLVCAIFTMRQNVWAIKIPEMGSASLSEAKRVTSENQVVEHHGISRDGRWLAFDSNRGGNQDIYVVPAAGGVPRRLTDDAAADYHPDYSPDGTEIVFYSIRHGSRDVFLMSADGSHEVRLTTSPAEEAHPSFSPDGLQIAFDRRDSVRRDVSRVFVMSRDSIGGEWTAPHALTPNASPSCIYPRWAPDGSQLSCWGFPGVRLVSLQGAMRVVLDAQAVGLLGVNWPDWSSDGRTLYFQGTDSTFAAGLYAFDVEGGTLRQVIRFDDPTKDVNYAHTIADGTVYFSVKEIESDLWLLDLEW